MCLCLCLRVRLCLRRRGEMMKIGRRLKGLSPGTHRYDGRGDLAHHRFHLRVDNQRKGVLLIDASKMIFLNGTAIDYVRALLEGWDESEIVAYMRSRYRRLETQIALDHYGRVKEQILGFMAGRLDIIKQVPSDTASIGSDGLPSPYRMDLALTYRCQNDCIHCYNEERRAQELPLEVWLAVVDRVREAGVPHIVFTGGEPTLSPHLRDLILRSEEHGQITGLITNGRRLGQDGYLRDLIKAGLDHVQITLLSHRASIHDSLTHSEGSWQETVEGIKVTVGEDVYLSTNTTIMRENAEDVEDTFRFLVGLKVRNLAFNGLIRSGKGRQAHGITHEELKSLLVKLVAMAQEEGVNLVWYTPTPYCEFNPVNHGLGIKQCTACSLNMAIEPDGTVLPCQSYYQPLGNILRDPWHRIWNHELCRRIRKREYLPDKCGDCGLRDVCGGGCPLAHTHEDYLCLDSHSSM